MDREGRDIMLERQGLHGAEEYLALKELKRPPARKCRMSFSIEDRELGKDSIPYSLNGKSRGRSMPCFSRKSCTASRGQRE